MHSLTLTSPAKLNLYLRVVGRYPDGYHRLVTIFHRISLKDTLRLTKRTRGYSLRCSNPEVPNDKRNLVTQAYDLLRKKFPRLRGVSVSLTKRIPVGSGLGGGSSNAAAFLLGMKKLYHLPLTLKDLVSLGKKLGADVPFFLYRVNQAIGKKRGDKIFPQPAKKTKWFLLFVFEKGLSTKQVYQNLPKVSAVSLTKVSRTVKMTCEFLDDIDLPGKKGLLQNDLEQAAIRLNPRIQQVKTKLHQLGASLVGLSGSGPTVFAVFSEQHRAGRLGHKLRADIPFGRIIICHSF
jgi:4-diphosphocytidyl-2-C-methyl-D-erythritol kinase